jgi:hypothetical protein
MRSERPFRALDVSSQAGQQLLLMQADDAALIFGLVGLGLLLVVTLAGFVW